MKNIEIFIAKYLKITSKWINSLIEWVIEDILLILLHHIQNKSVADCSISFRKMAKNDHFCEGRKVGRGKIF